MANRQHVNPRPLTPNETRHFKSLLENEECWPDFEKILMEVTRYSVELPRLYNILIRAQLDHNEYELQESRRYALEWLKDVEQAAKKMCKLADKLWSTNGHAVNRRAALDLAGWKSKYQIDFLNYAHAIEEIVRKTKGQFVRSRNRPARAYKHRAIQSMKTIGTPKHLCGELLTSLSLVNLPK